MMYFTAAPISSSLRDHLFSGAELSLDSSLVSSTFEADDERQRDQRDSDPYHQRSQRSQVVLC